jgi:hypothetical protein
LKGGPERIAFFVVYGADWRFDGSGISMKA